MGGRFRMMANGPLLWLGSRIALDCRFIDRIELAERFTDPGNQPRLLLAIEETEVAIEFQGTQKEAQELIVGIAPYTRAAPLVSDEDYADAEELRDAIMEGHYEPAPVLAVDGTVVLVEDGIVSTGLVGYVADDVTGAAQRGDSVELAMGGEIPAAIFQLAVAAAKPPSVASIESRLTEYRERRRTRNPS